jgi:hypothetical protein
MTAADQSTGALLIIAALLVAATPVVAVMIGLEWWADRRRRPRYTRHPDDLPLVVPASVRVWTEDMGSGDGLVSVRRIDEPVNDGVRIIDTRDRQAVLVDAEAAGWLPAPDSVDSTTIRRAARRATT